MKALELRQKFLDFFKDKGHAVIPSASLIPENDPSVLFTTAGMQPLVPYLMGQKHQSGTRLVDVQKCLRTGDIDEVGDVTHHTFFEMLGNWSLGDYFKKETVTWSFEFLTKTLGISVDRLAVTVFAGDADAAKDEEVFTTWRSLGIPEERIALLDKSSNWWPAGGKHPGPQGPCTEMFYWRDESRPAPKVYDPEDNTWVEIWNDVFMQFSRTSDGKFEPLKQQNVDTGMGLERTTAVLNNLNDNYRTDLFWPIIQVIERLSNHTYDESPEIKRAMRIIADHVKAAVMVMGDTFGMEPSNVDQGYILRRLIRRAVRMGRTIGLHEKFLLNVATPVYEIYGDVYPEIVERKEFVTLQLDLEETKFRDTLDKGMKEFGKIVANSVDKKISGSDAFLLFSSCGFPLEITQELATEQCFTVDVDAFNSEFFKHQELSRQNAGQKFKGGLVDVSETSVKYHTATHLLHAALRKVLGPTATQKGSNITPERLRFDFAWPEKMTDAQKKAVEDLVNAAIARDYAVSFEEVLYETAKTRQAIGLFADNYGEKVKVYSVGDPEGTPDADPSSASFSRELCGGPHVEHTGMLGTFKIIKEEACSAGVRRIKAVLE